MSMPVVRVTGWEGDDILGTVAARDEALGYRTLLVSGDKDVYQLCSELTTRGHHAQGHHRRGHLRPGRGARALRRGAFAVPRFPGP